MFTTQKQTNIQENNCFSIILKLNNLSLKISDLSYWSEHLTKTS